MAGPALRFLEYVFLALLYLFLLRVVRAVWVELREPRLVSAPPGQPGPPPPATRAAASTPTGRNVPRELAVISPQQDQGAGVPSRRRDQHRARHRVRGALPTDTFVSQVHARVFRRGDEYWVEDLGSTNGTFVNGRKLTGASAVAPRGPRAGGPHRPGAAQVSKLLVGSATDVGLVRSNNQDQFLVSPGLYAVADGMGGHAAGEVASSTAITALAAAFEASDQHSAGSLESAAKAANRAVWEQARTNRAMLGMGTTLVALAVVERQTAPTGWRSPTSVTHGSTSTATER